MVNRENVKVVTNFLFLGSRIIADGDCSHEIRTQLLPARKWSEVKWSEVKWSEVKWSEVTWPDSRSVMSSFLQTHRLYSWWNSPGQNTGVGSLSLLQGIFSTWGSKPALPHCKRILYQLNHKGRKKYKPRECAESLRHCYADKRPRDKAVSS